MSTAAYAHVEITPDGVPIIAGTKTKVIEIALDRLAHHWDAEEIKRQHPHLTLGQIHSALAWYYDHQDDMDQEIQSQLDDVRRIKASVGESAVRRKLKGLGQLP
jgi:uncharacterized protein (DUF433 family)